MARSRSTLLALLLLAVGCAEARDPRGREEAGAADAEAASTSDDDAGGGGDGGSSSSLDATSEVDARAEDAALDAAEEGGAVELDAAVAGDAGVLDAGAVQPAQDAGVDAGLSPQSPTATYLVEMYSGGLNHLVIQKQDAARGYCVLVRIAQPMSPDGRYAIEVPQSWGVVIIMAVERASCGLSSSGTPVATHAPVAAVGRIAFLQDSTFGRVCSLDLDVLLTFGADAGVVPEREHLYARNLAVPCDG